MLDAQSRQHVLAIAPANYTGAAAEGDIVTMKAYRHLTILIQTGAWAAGTAAVTVEQTTDVSNSLTDNKAVAFTRMWSKASSAETFTDNTVTSNTFNLSAANTIYLIELNAEDLDVDNNFDCVRLMVATPGANDDFYGATYILSEPRYSAGTMPGAIVD